MSSVRDEFFNTIFNQIKAGEDIYIITADIGAPSLDDLRKYYPDRYISVGIAEQNLIAAASGLALNGHHVIAYGLAPFPSTRAFDQLRSVVAGLDIPITICGLNAGLCSAESGYTHMPVDDYAILRTLPDLEIYNPSDFSISRKLAKETINISHPRFIRFDKAIKFDYYGENIIDFARGFSIYNGFSQGGDVLLVSFGIYIEELRNMLRKFIDAGKKVALADFYKTPVNEQDFAQIASHYKRIITVEENVLKGGLGSYVLELLSDYEVYVPVKRMGLDLSSGTYKVYTSRNYIRKDQKISVEDVQSEISAYLGDTE